jgi:tetratricopeptide (TPR) repeat protein
MTQQNLSSLFQTALAHHQGGRVAEAERLYRTILQAEPNHPLALHHLGIVAIQCGRPDTAIGLISRSLQIEPAAAAWNNLGEAFRTSNRVPEAVDCYRKAIAMDARQVDALANLGVALTAQKKIADAERSLREAIALAPNHLPAMLALARLLAETDRHDEALNAWERVVRLAPNNPVFQCCLGAAWISAGDPYRALVALRKAVELEPRHAEAHAKMALAYDKLNRGEDAIAAARQAVALAPDNWHAHHDLAVFLQKANQFEGAIAAFDEAIKLDPRNASIYGARAVSLKLAGRLSEAAESYLQGAKLDASDPRFWSGLSAVRFAQRDFQAAVAASRAAVKLRPKDVDAHAALAFALLASGDFDDGFKEYEWRWRDAAFTTKPRDFDRPMWDGSDPAGRRILVHCEQGFGDIFQFLRYVPMIRARGATVILETTYKVAGIVRRMAGDIPVIVSGTMLPDFDLHVPMLSLPVIFGTSTASVPAAVPYLTADANLASQWQSKLEATDGLRVGLVWSGNAKPDPKRSTTLAELAPLARVAGISFISIQPPPRSADAENPPAGMKLQNIGGQLGDLWDPTAYVLSQLDLLITIDSGIAHLAGAMGVRTWVLLPHSYDWRWVLKYPASAWYPSVRLFRQSAPNEWAEAIEQVAVELAEFSERKPSGRGGKAGTGNKD